jgi:signal transduction histidine kinase
MRVATDPSSEGGSAHRLLVDDAEFVTALAHGLDLPLAALRASMESLNQLLPMDARGQGALEGALEEVTRLGRNVQDLIQLATPPEPMPLRCSTIEILMAARNTLPEGLRSRVLIARVCDSGTIRIDAPLLARCLTRLIENAFEAGSEQVLIVSRREDDLVRFGVVDNSPRHFDADWAVPAFHSTKRNHMGLGLAITQRDVALMGGTFELDRTQRGGTCVTVTVPDRSPTEEPEEGLAA